MKYKVIKFFTDLKDGGHPYNEGDSYPREGLKVDKERIMELSGSDNRQGVPLIESVSEDLGKDKAAADTKKTGTRRSAKRT